jgi:hypothetical protein
MDTQTQIDRLIELAIVQRTDLKKLVSELPQLREHLSAEIERTFDEFEPQLRTELEEFCATRADDKHAKLSAELGAKIESFSRALQDSAQAKFSALLKEREENVRVAKEAEAKIAEHAASLPSAVKEIVDAELSRFPRAGEIDQLRKEFQEPRGLNPRGKWTAGEVYNKLDLVAYNGDSFVSNTNGNRERPNRASEEWTLNAARGNSGNGGGIASLTDILPIPSSGQILGSEGPNYTPKTLVAGANITITETPTQITITGDEGQIELQDGTAAAPSLFFVNDVDTGLFRPGTNLLGIAAGGQAAITIGATEMTLNVTDVKLGGDLSIDNDTLFIDKANSRVGIGTSTPEASLVVRSQGSTNSRSILVEHNDNTTAFSQAKFIGARSRGSHGSPSAVLANDSLVSFNGRGYKTNAWSNTVGGFYVYAAENWTNTATGSFAAFRLAATGGTTVSEVARLTSTGNLLVGGATDISGAGGLKVFGTTASTSTTTGALQVAGGVSVQGALYNGGGIQITPSDTTWATLKTIPANAIATSGAIFAPLGTVTNTNPEWALGHRFSAHGNFAIWKFNGSNHVANYLTIAASDGAVTVSSTTASTSTTTGSLVLSGGLGVAGALFTGGNVTVNGGTVGTAASTNLTLAGGSSGASLVLGQGTNALATITPSGTGRLLVDKTNAANDTIQSGLGVNFGADPTLGALAFTVRGFPSATGGSRFVTIGASDGGNVRRLVLGADGSGNFSNVLIGGTTDITGSGGLKVFGTTASTSTTTGALQVAGGVGVAGALFAGGASRIPRIGLGADPDADYKLYSFVSGGTNNPILIARTGLDAPIAFDLVHTTRILNFVDRQFPSTRFSFDFTNGNFVSTGSLTTSAPTGGAGAWELGVANTVTPTAPNRTITIEIGGTVYYLHAKTTND